MRIMVELDFSSLGLDEMERFLPELIGEIAKRKAILPSVATIFTLGELIEFDKIPSKLDQIKIYRKRTGCNLRDAKTAIDRHYAV